MEDDCNDCGTCRRCVDLADLADAHRAERREWGHLMDDIRAEAEQAHDDCMDLVEDFHAVRDLVLALLAGTATDHDVATLRTLITKHN